jgi:ribosomal protein S17
VTYAECVYVFVLVVESYSTHSAYVTCQQGGQKHILHTQHMSCQQGGHVTYAECVDYDVVLLVDMT